MYTHLLLISTVQFPRAYCSFSIIIYLLCQNKCFVIFYKFEQTCSNVQFIPSPIEVREFLLRLLNKIPAQNLFSLHIWQDLALLCRSVPRRRQPSAVLSPIRCKILLDGGRRRTKIYMVFLREPSRRDRSGSDLFHLRDGFEIKMNFDRNVSCFIFVNALMHDDFFD